MRQATTRTRGRWRRIRIRRRRSRGRGARARYGVEDRLKLTLHVCHARGARTPCPHYIVHIRDARAEGDGIIV